ncbi:pyridoxamine 5'-phosphate oxidase family protein [Leisingera daeponensis]|uniref:Pyridoxamine 5'-phosphate oxidase family protein n=1 Tax=Leisingera daeponensis TaxID=405746 RepID=A0ABS7NKD5_9RHOB|nr:pyridoxamine 5'-phosphate oxidase family protein [Leisingera daeponensis]MBY6141672.1 pyridoxamine 5'-phosphate oxidase family protein [Leisingera daeponensis]
MADVIRPTDDEARALAQSLMAEARFAALGVLLEDGQPLVTRVAFGLDAQGQPVSLVSDLALHTGALRRHPPCSLMVGEPGAKGDALTHPRLSLLAEAEFVPRQGPAHEALAATYLRHHPKAKLYLQFADFSFVRFAVTAAHLNGGFGKAFRLAAADLLPNG